MRPRVCVLSFTAVRALNLLGLVNVSSPTPNLFAGNAALQLTNPGGGRVALAVAAGSTIGVTLPPSTSLRLETLTVGAGGLTVSLCAKHHLH